MEKSNELAWSCVRIVTTRHVWFFDILFMSKYMKLLSQLKVYDIQLTKIETSKTSVTKCSCDVCIFVVTRL